MVDTRQTSKEHQDIRNDIVARSLDFLFVLCTRFGSEEAGKLETNGYRLKKPPQNPLFSQRTRKRAAWQDRKFLQNITLQPNNTGKKLWPSPHPCQQRLAGEPRLSPLQPITRCPNTPMRQHQRKPSREPGLTSYLGVASPPPPRHQWRETMWRYGTQTSHQPNREPPHSDINGNQVKNLNFYLHLTVTRWHNSLPLLACCQRRPTKTG